MKRGRKPTEVDLSTYSSRVGQAIKSRREKAGVAAGQLAEVLGVTVGNVYQWERGVRAPHLDLLPAIAEALGCTIRTLLPPE